MRLPALHVSRLATILRLLFPTTPSRATLLPVIPEGRAGEDDEPRDDETEEGRD